MSEMIFIDNIHSVWHCMKSKQVTMSALISTNSSMKYHRHQAWDAELYLFGLSNIDFCMIFVLVLDRAPQPSPFADVFFGFAEYYSSISLHVLSMRDNGVLIVLQSIFINQLLNALDSIPILMSWSYSKINQQKSAVCVCEFYFHSQSNNCPCHFNSSSSVELFDSICWFRCSVEFNSVDVTTWDGLSQVVADCQLCPHPV